jgi:hypothetical protein
MKSIRRAACVFLFLGVFTVSSYAITWFPKEFTCPVDNEKNTFLVVGSYGSYIYSYPSKYQWLFFPMTDSPTYYVCKKCHLTTYMWDFDEIPKEKIPELKKILAGVKLSKSIEKEYTEIPVVERLEIMQKVYTVLDKDEDWWETFYRVKGYHYGANGKTKEAAEARKKSLEYITGFLKNDEYKDNKKLLLYMSGAMKHFLGEDKGALEDLGQALNTKVQDSTGKTSAEELKEYEDGLNERLKDYIERINGDEKPRLSETKDHGH